MDKDEMKNRISMALKDPTLQQGFEIICKENTEMKKENENLASIAEHQQSSNMKRYFEIEELKRENAELKEQLNKNPCVRNTEWHCNDCLEQLTKAKELLAKWVELFKPKSETALPTPIQVDTEQFLKESEVEK